VTEAKLMDDAEEVKEDDENTNRSSSKSLTLHPDKALLENEEVDPVKINKDSESLKFPIDELKARLKKLKQEGVEDVSNMNVTIFYYQYTKFKFLIISFFSTKNRINDFLYINIIFIIFYIIIITVYNFVYMY